MFLGRGANFFWLLRVSGKGLEQVFLLAEDPALLLEGLGLVLERGLAARLLVFVLDGGVLGALGGHVLRN